MTFDLMTLAILAIIFVATVVRSTFGFGEALIAMPLLSLLLDIRVVTPLVAVISFTIAASVVLTDWRKVQFKSVRALVISGSLGLPIGILFFRTVPENIVKLVLAVLILSFSTYALFRPRLPHLSSDRTAPAFGFVSGVLTGAYNVGGPPLVIFGTLRQWPTEVFRATLQGTFLWMGGILLLLHTYYGSWTAEVGRYYVLSLPVVVVAVVIGGRLNRSFQLRSFVSYVYGFLIIVGVMLLVQSLS